MSKEMMEYPSPVTHKRVTVEYAYCCSGSVRYCDCVNKNHGTALMGENEAGDDYPVVSPAQQQHALVGRDAALEEAALVAESHAPFTEAAITASTAALVLENSFGVTKSRLARQIATSIRSMKAAPSHSPSPHLRGHDFECAGEPLAENEMKEGLRHQAEYLDQLKEDQE